MEKYMGKIGRKKANKKSWRNFFLKPQNLSTANIWPGDESQLSVWAFVFAMDYAGVEPVLNMCMMSTRAVFILYRFPVLHTKGHCWPYLALQCVG